MGRLGDSAGVWFRPYASFRGRQAFFLLTRFNRTYPLRVEGNPNGEFFDAMDDVITEALSYLLR